MRFLLLFHWWEEMLSCYVKGTRVCDLFFMTQRAHDLVDVALCIDAYDVVLIY